jgi:hypothetical protein
VSRGTIAAAFAFSNVTEQQPRFSEADLKDELKPPARAAEASPAHIRRPRLAQLAAAGKQLAAAETP